MITIHDYVLWLLARTIHLFSERVQYIIEVLVGAWVNMTYGGHHDHD